MRRAKERRVAHVGDALVLLGAGAASLERGARHGRHERSGESDDVEELHRGEVDERGAWKRVRVGVKSEEGELGWWE
jgi:hypothetical protein